MSQIFPFENDIKNKNLHYDYPGVDFVQQVFLDFQNIFFIKTKTKKLNPDKN